MQYLGLDCSTKAIHGVWLDEEGNILDQRKWASKDIKIVKQVNKAYLLITISLSILLIILS